jgi:hypothetical protein
VSTATAFVHVDITARGVALVSGRGFHGRVTAGCGPRSAMNRPTYTITLTDITSESLVDIVGHEPLAPVTRALRKGFPAAVADMARALAGHYGVTDAVITVDDNTGLYTLTED